MRWPTSSANRARSPRRPGGRTPKNAASLKRSSARARIFEKKMELRRERLAVVEERLEDQRAELQERSAARADIIERRYNELLGESDALEW